MFWKDNRRKCICTQLLPCSWKPTSYEASPTPWMLWRWGWDESPMELSTKAFQRKGWCFLLRLLFWFYTLHSLPPTKDVGSYFRYAFLVILLSKRHWMLWIAVYSHTFLMWHICNFLVLNGGTEEKIWKDERECKGRREQTDRKIPQGQRTLPLSKEILSLKSRSYTKIFLCHFGSVKGSQHKKLDSWE